MESPNNLHRHLQDHPSPLQNSSSSCFPLGTTLSWTPNITLNGGNLNPIFQEANPRSTALPYKKDIIRDPSPLNDPMLQGLGYNNQWASETSDHELDLQYSKIKEEISDAFPKFTEMLNTNALSEKLLLKTLSSGDFYDSSTITTTSSSSHSFASFGGVGMGDMAPHSRGSFSQIYPSVNISSLNQSSSSSPPMSRSLDMNMQCSDLLASARFNGALSHPSQDGLARFTDNLSFRLDHMQRSIDGSTCNSSNPSHFPTGMAETKRPNALVESKASHQSQTVTKKSRLESRSSCPPFKVRKEKLGDRIAALQQLVAPFGKTDTASVLMEAIGYIKFLQNQVETLSVPYMKSSRNQTNRAMQGISGTEEVKEEAKLDLRSRGLCLVPLSCMSYLAGDGTTGVWQQPDFGGAT